MKNTEMWKDRKAVSPVIGVVLMVGVTVVLAASVAMFAFEIGASLQSPPLLYFRGGDVDADDDVVYLTAIGTSSVPLNELTATVEIEGEFSTDDSIEIVAGKEETNPTVDPGDIISIDASCDVGDKVRILVVHTPTGIILSETTARATA